MEKSSSVAVRNGGNGILKLPIGFRFHPTDAELILHYLNRKVYSLPLPASVISDHSDVFRSHPSLLPGDSKEKRYYFSKRKGIINVGNSITAGSAGYWKIRGKDKLIVAPALGTNQLSVVGMKKSLVFYEYKRPRGLRTPWLMHEYRLPSTTSTQQMEDWVICCIYQKKSKARRSQGVNKTQRQQQNSCSNKKSRNASEVKISPSANKMDVMMEHSSVTSSGITEVSSDELDQEACSSPANICLSPYSCTRDH